MKLFKIHPGDNTPITSSFQLWSHFKIGPQPRIDMVTEKLGEGAAISDMMKPEHINTSWFYSVARDYADGNSEDNCKHWLDDSPDGWRVQIYLTTEEQLTFCALAFDKWIVK